MHITALVVVVDPVGPDFLFISLGIYTVKLATLTDRRVTVVAVNGPMMLAVGSSVKSIPSMLS